MTPLIKPPSDDVIEQPIIQSDKIDYKRIIEYLDCENWKCPKCGSVIFGRTLRCPYNKNGDYCYGVRVG